MWFRETPVFTDRFRKAGDDEDLRALQSSLLQRPTQGVIIPGSRGIRKLRWGTRGTGKRGGLRVLYYWEPGSELFYLLLVYAKNVQENLTATQLRLLVRVVEEELK